MTENILIEANLKFNFISNQTNQKFSPLFTDLHFNSLKLTSSCP